MTEYVVCLTDQLGIRHINPAFVSGSNENFQDVVGQTRPPPSLSHQSLKQLEDFLGRAKQPAVAGSGKAYRKYHCPWRRGEKTIHNGCDPFSFLSISYAEDYAHCDFMDQTTQFLLDVTRLPYPPTLQHPLRDGHDRRPMPLNLALAEGGGH
jgi:hypothetical protein